LDESRAPREINWWLWARWPIQMRAYDTDLAAAARREYADLFLLLVDCMERFTTYDRWDAASDRFNMRALLIRQLGQVDGSATWNADALMRDVLAMLTLSPSQAREQADQLRSLLKAPKAGPTLDSATADRILILLNHKRVLNPLASVAHLLSSSPDADLARQWLATRLDLS
jgi:hypothetical protein